MSNFEKAVLKKAMNGTESGIANPRLNIERRSQNEFDGQHYENDVLSQFRANLANVEELTKKLKFMICEVQYLIKNK